VDEYDVPVPPATPEGEVDMPALKIEGQKFIRSVSSASEFVIDAAPGTHLAWNPAEIPENLSVMLIDGGTTVDMSTADEHIVCAPNPKIVVSRLPDRVALLPNKPNPFNASTEIAFQLPAEQDVRVEIYDIFGRRIRTLFDGKAHAGTNKLVWHGNDEAGNTVASGVYFVRLRTQDKELTRKITFIK